MQPFSFPWLLILSVSFTSHNTFGEALPLLEGEFTVTVLSLVC